MSSAGPYRRILLAYLTTGLLVIVAGIISPGFISGSHIATLVQLAAFVGIVALGQTFVVIGGGIDLSVPWVLNGAAVFLTIFAHSRNEPLLWAVPVVLAAGAGIGVINGAGIVLAGVPPIIMTLAVNVIVGGCILLITHGGPTPTSPPALRFLAVGRIAGFPAVLGIWATLTIAASVLLSKTGFGRYLYAAGTNMTVSVYSGVPTSRTIVTSYALSGFTAAFVGMLLTGYTGQAYLGMGDPYLFTSIAAVAIGGTSIMGGSGHYVGTIAGAFLLTILTALLPALNLSTGALQIVYGIVILFTVFLASEEAPKMFAHLLHRRSV